MELICRYHWGWTVFSTKQTTQSVEQEKIRAGKTDRSCWQLQKRHSPSEERDCVNLLKQTLASCNINVKSCSGNSADCWQHRGLSTCLLPHCMTAACVVESLMWLAGLAEVCAEVGIILHKITRWNVKLVFSAALCRFKTGFYSISEAQRSNRHRFFWHVFFDPHHSPLHFLTCPLGVLSVFSSCSPLRCCLRTSAFRTCFTLPTLLVLAPGFDLFSAFC